MVSIINSYMEPINDNSARNSAPSESLPTVPIYNLDISSSGSDSDDMGPTDGSQTSYVYLKL